MAQHLPYFDPRTLSKLEGLTLHARGTVEGAVTGAHRSPFHGFAAEFAEHREYAKADSAFGMVLPYIVVTALVVIVAGGVREELQRAFLLHRFRASLRMPWLGLAITSIAFGLGHTLQGLDAAVMTGTLGFIWGALFLARGSALAPMISHSLFNSGELLRIFTG